MEQTEETIERPESESWKWVGKVAVREVKEGTEEPDSVEVPEEYPIDRFQTDANRVRVPVFVPGKIVHVTNETRFLTDENGHTYLEGNESGFVMVEYIRNGDCWKRDRAVKD